VRGLAPRHDLGRHRLAVGPAIAEYAAAQHAVALSRFVPGRRDGAFGTALPFEIVGAPWIDADALADRLHAEGWGAPLGAGFRPHRFAPLAGKWAGEECQGVQVHILDRARWRPLEAWLGVIITIRAMYPGQFAWLPPSDPESVYHFDRLLGGPWMRKEIEAGVAAGQGAAAILGRFGAEWLDDARAFEGQRAPYLLYA